MSTKQFISAEEHLAKLDFTVQQANDFIVGNIDEPDAIFIAARVNGVTLNMLSEITDVSTVVISEYFTNAERDPEDLNDTHKLINSDLGTLETLVTFNNNTGILSTTSLRDAVQPQLDILQPYNFFIGEPVYSFQKDDGIYDTEELGVGHLGDLPATDENIESLLYGTLINAFSALDASELDQINTFPENGNHEDFQALITASLSNESPASVVWTDEELANLVIDETVEIIGKHFSNNLVGILDHSFLGLATA